MNSQQELTTIQHFLTVAGAIAVATGIVAPDKVGPLVDAALLIIGTILPVGSLAFSLFKHTEDNAVATAQSILDRKSAPALVPAAVDPAKATAT